MIERGALLGSRYQLDTIIGRGGMAEVWRARDLRLERDVAVKRLRVDLASDPTFQARFRREAQSAAGLNHPNIVAVYDTGEERGAGSDVSVPYIVMELVEGVTLREVLRDGRKIVPERALEFTAGVLDALAYAHRAGIVHRDIKPANVMLTPDGTVKVMDFGIARAVADTSATMTQTAAVIGTAQYLSPEQARGEKVDNRSDIYSVGCLLYELLTSQPLFKGDSPVSVAYQHVREIPVPPSQLDAEVTPPMDAIVLKSLEKDPGDRYSDAAEMRDDIFRCIAGEPVQAMNPADQTTRVIPSDPMTTTARRGVVQTTIAATPPGVPDDPEAEIDTDEEEPKSRKGLIALLTIAGLVLVGIIVAIALLLTGGPGEAEPSPTPTPSPTISASPSPSPSPSPSAESVLVPALEGKTELEAERLLRDAELVGDRREEAGTEEDQGTVLRQEPIANMPVEVGSTVVYFVSTGATGAEIPASVLDVPFETARDLLKGLGFTNVQPAREADPATEPIGAEAGRVISVSPPEGKSVAFDTPITLTVATGKSVVPSLTGMNEAAARQRAENAGFTIKVKLVQTGDQAPGLVFEQSVPENTVIERGTQIEVSIAEPIPDASASPDAAPGG